MALGPVGSAIFVNQQVPFVSSIKADHTARFDLQNIMAQQITNEKDKEIEEVRPTEENHAVDPDREHQRQEADEELENQKNAAEGISEEEKEKSVKLQLHKLDIRV